MSTKALRRQHGSPARRRLPGLVLIVVAGVALLVIGVVLLFVAKPTPAQVAVAIKPPQVGSPMSDFTLSDLSGKQVRLSDFRGRPVLINAWATWCPPCRAEMPDLYKLYQDHQQDGFVVLAINSGEGSKQVKDFIQQSGFMFPVLLDPDNTLLDALGIRNLPTSIVVGQDGIVRAMHVGMLTPAAIQSTIVPLLAQ
jgi:peroxiredoxin